jgi:hypothetical protein
MQNKSLDELTLSDIRKEPAMLLRAGAKATRDGQSEASIDGKTYLMVSQLVQQAQSPEEILNLFLAAEKANEQGLQSMLAASLAQYDQREQSEDESSPGIALLGSPPEVQFASKVLRMVARSVIEAKPDTVAGQVKKYTQKAMTASTIASSAGLANFTVTHTDTKIIRFALESAVANDPLETDFDKIEKVSERLVKLRTQALEEIEPNLIASNPKAFAHELSNAFILGMKAMQADNMPGEAATGADELTRMTNLMLGYLGKDINQTLNQLHKVTTTKFGAALGKLSYEQLKELHDELGVIWEKDLQDKMNAANGRPFELNDRLAIEIVMNWLDETAQQQFQAIRIQRKHYDALPSGFGELLQDLIDRTPPRRGNAGQDGGTPPLP